MRSRIEIALGGLIAAVGLLVVGTDVLAQANAMDDGNWSLDAATVWDSGEPNQTTSAIINGSHTVTIDQAGEETNLVDLGTIASETGNLNITGGDLTVSNVNSADFPSTIRVGQLAGSTGNLTMTDGTVNINGDVGSGFAIADLLVGDAGTGTMTMSGGTFTVADEIFVGLGGTSNGTLNVSGGTLAAAGRNLLVGFFGGATGNFNLSGTGIVNVDDFVFTSFDPGATSNLTQTGGTLNVGIAYVQGRNGNSSFTHSGGAVNVTTAQGNGDFVIGDNGPNNTYDVSGTAEVNAGRDFLVAVFSTADATVNQSGGTINIDRFLRIGIDGTGDWNQTGGTVNVADSVWLGDFDSSHGTFKSSGGTLNITKDLSVGAALASNAPANPTGTQGQAVDADGTLIVSGSGGTINVDRNLLANPDDNSRFGGGGEHNDATLIFEILDNSGVSTIDVAGIADLTGADIDVDILGGSFGIGSFFDLITATDISEDFLQVPEDIGTFRLDVIAGGNGEILRATIIPEPASMLLITLGAVAALGISARRRKPASLCRPDAPAGLSAGGCNGCFA